MVYGGGISEVRKTADLQGYSHDWAVFDYTTSMRKRDTHLALFPSVDRQLFCTLGLRFSKAEFADFLQRYRVVGGRGDIRRS